MRVPDWIDPSNATGVVLTLLALLTFLWARRRIHGIRQRTALSISFLLIGYVAIYLWFLKFLRYYHDGYVALLFLVVLGSCALSLLLAVALHRFRRAARNFAGDGWVRFLDYPYLLAGLGVFYTLVSEIADGSRPTTSHPELPLWLSLVVIARLAKTHLETGIAARVSVWLARFRV